MDDQPTPDQAKALEIVQASKRPLDGANHYKVGMRHGAVVIMSMRGYEINLPVVLSYDQALNLAAWLAVYADPDMTTLPRLVEQIKNEPVFNHG